MGINNIPDYLPALPTRGSIEDKIIFLYGVLAQLWRIHVEDQTEISRLKSLVNSETSTKRIIELIRSANGHSSAMPDRLGENKDHDRRYVTIDMWRRFIAGEVQLDGLQIGIWKWTADGTDLDFRYDANLGVGSPDFTAEPPYETDSPP